MKNKNVTSLHTLPLELYEHICSYINVYDLNNVEQIRPFSKYYIIKRFKEITRGNLFSIKNYINKLNTNDLYNLEHYGFLMALKIPLKSHSLHTEINFH